MVVSFIDFSSFIYWEEEKKSPQALLSKMTHLAVAFILWENKVKINPVGELSGAACIAFVHYH